MNADERRLVTETRDIWDAKAAFWDERMGEGNVFQRELIAPATERLLALRRDELVLDVGCGNGVFARRLAQLGARVVAVDFSARFLERAQARGVEHADRVEYRLVDATDEAQLLTLGEGRFAAVVCDMAMMDMPVIDPLLGAAAKLLAPGGRFVFSVQHPAFNSNAVSLCAELSTTDDGLERVTHAVKIRDYLTVPAGKGMGMPGEPEPHWYFHRPLHELLGACFAAGFVVDGLEEPALAAEGTDPHCFDWRNVPGIPPVLVVRLVPRRGP
jgi:2-polyprenyl-3-methyl-5-hydroxy-6-metoxy-1,4-benzoquinol methylase